MHLKQLNPRAWFVAGVLSFLLGSAGAEDAAITAEPLTGPATGVVPVVPEPFVNPFWTKAPKIISSFGKREVPASLKAPVVAAAAGAVPLGPEVHEGVDYAAISGSAVRASRGGKVIFAGSSKTYASRIKKTEQYRMVIIRHPDGMSSRYVHLNSLHVRPGQDVSAGQVLGVLAESDEWTEPVLHFEIRGVQGQALDPAKVVVPVQTLTTGAVQ